MHNYEQFLCTELGFGEGTPPSNSRKRNSVIEFHISKRNLNLHFVETVPYIFMFLLEINFSFHVFIVLTKCLCLYIWEKGIV